MMSLDHLVTIETVDLPLLTIQGARFRSAVIRIAMQTPSRMGHQLHVSIHQKIHQLLNLD